MKPTVKSANGKPKGRRCMATTKTGSPCRAAPLSNRTVCLAHADPITRGSTGFTGEAGRKGGRPRQPRAVDVIRERLEDHADEIITIYLDATRAVTPDGQPNHAMRLKAADALLDRVYGKPKQVSELSGPERGSIERVQIPTEEEFNLAVAGILRDADALEP